MLASLERLFERYRIHHESQSLLQWIGGVGAVAFPVLYLLRLTSIVPPRYDDVAWRVVAVVLCIGLALRRWWPERLRGVYIGYSYLVVFYCLSFLMTFTSMMNQGGALSVVNMVMGTVLIILLADWRNAVVMLVGGYALAAGAYLYIEPTSPIPSAIAVAALTSILVVVAGALSHAGQKRAEHERLRQVYTGLAGSIAHEVRTPLAQVQHALRRISGQVSAGSDAGLAAEQGLMAVQRGLQSITITLQQMGDRQPQSSEFVWLSAAQCVRDAVAGYAYESQQARDCVRLRIEKDFGFRGEATAIQLVVFNLLRNALYYLPLHPQMTVNIQVSSEPVPRIAVRDTGPGIDPRLASKLFQEFQTLGKAEGTGLGLSFCRRVMRGLGGDIECRSEWGHFTEFTLRFPLAPAGAPVTTVAPASVALAGRSVLIVDDQPLNRTIARALVGELSLTVMEAEHGQQALDMLQAGQLPDAILMDINMPGLDGIAATRRLRALPGDAGRVPVLALTANDSAAVQARARQAGMQGVLGKPIDPAALQRALSAALQGRSTAPASPPPAPAADLLSTTRIENFRRLGLLDDLLPRALLDLRRHVQSLEQAATSDDREGVSAALHALVGLAGEVGAQALHARARERYAGWLEGQRPGGEGWTRELRELLEATERALWQYCGVRAERVPPLA